MAKDGFTLLEIMVSIAILSFGLILILQGFTHSLNVLRISENNLKATLLAQEQLTQIQLNAENSNIEFLEELSGDMVYDNIEFNWETTLSPHEEYGDLNNVLTVMSWQEGKRKGEIPIVTYLRATQNE